MPKDLLWEIGLEEVPARFLPPAIDQMNKLAAAAFAANGLSYDQLKVYATPRRLTLLVSALAEKAADVATEQKGPALKAAYDADGQPTRALEGFCRSQGVSAEQLTQREVNGNVYLFAHKLSQGRQTCQLLPELLNSLIDKLSFPKPMRWGYNSRRFVRPVRWLVALYGPDLVELEFAGVHSDRVTRGHRLLGSDNIPLNEPGEYLEKLRQNFVVCDQEERRQLCWRQIQEVAAALGGQVAEDEELLEEVTFLLEYPTALAGQFEDKYLAIPQELVITPMREHQRYFPVYDQEGRLLPRFITVRNGDSRFLEIVAEGNEKVLRARLADAEFFYNEDLRDKMEDKVEDLAQVVFHEKLGTMGQKVGRIVTLAQEIGRLLGYSPEELAATRRAAYLAKADLGSHVVYEFPELQGIIGEYYAQAAGEEPVVAQAIREHYLPRFAGDQLPESKPGVAVALADKLDSLCGFFAIGLIPSGSQDPYALRRAAAGCTQIILRHQLYLPLRELLPLAFRLVEADADAATRAKMVSDGQRLENAVTFLHQRLANILADEGVSYDVINAVESIGVAKADLLGELRRARALSAYRRGQRFHTLLAGFNRAANILRSAADKVPPGPLSVDPALFADESEHRLYQALSAVKPRVLAAVEEGDYCAALDEAETLSPRIHDFFEQVMVLDPDEKIRCNRIALLRQLVELTDGVGDLSRIEDKG